MLRPFAVLGLIALARSELSATDSCENDYCASWGDDCCAPGHEDAACDVGYVAVRKVTNPGCWGEKDGIYTCCLTSANVTGAELEAEGFKWEAGPHFGDCNGDEMWGGFFAGSMTLYAIHALLAGGAVFAVLRANREEGAAQGGNAVGLFPSFSSGGEQSGYQVLAGYSSTEGAGEGAAIVRRCRIVVQLVACTCAITVFIESAQVLMLVFALLAADCQELLKYWMYFIFGPLLEAIINGVYSAAMFYVALRGVQTRNKACGGGGGCCCCGPTYGMLTAFHQWAIVGAVLSAASAALSALGPDVYEDSQGVVTGVIYSALLSVCAHHAGLLLRAVAALNASNGGTQGVEMSAPTSQHPPIVGVVLESGIGGAEL